MKVIVFGATGMVGQAVLQACLLDPGVDSVLAVVRRSTGRHFGKVRELVHGDFHDFSAISGELSGYDACLFCLGVSAVGMDEAAYRRVTFDITMAAARVLAEHNPGMTFVYVSGQGTDSTESGRSMWARVKGATENALLDLPFSAYMFRPGYIQPRGVTSGTKLYRAVYAVTRPLYPVLRRLLPNSVTSSDRVGRAMVTVARTGAPKRVLETRDINELGA
ncbi:NAD-dependent epimerase/dehydratase family protein [Streptomyces sp. WMMB 322]|uniref:NAD-dependent epimerase/dehydratase family protein n=1 Tax=Streptomyces sp. WMMB 322 TaxID=1286821 RepID=UPI0006E3EC12|nr:NAD-dependent epimerase/dehydratase family protein [Streptomyces sp. WMMB 322]SCK06168.1 Predicted nucleoside-diphosphate-sugar epimerases [Streptomyces sp. WMMB 322]